MSFHHPHHHHCYQRVLNGYLSGPPLLLRVDSHVTSRIDHHPLRQPPWWSSLGGGRRCCSSPPCLVVAVAVMVEEEEEEEEGVVATPQSDANQINDPSCRVNRRGCPPGEKKSPHRFLYLFLPWPERSLTMRCCSSSLRSVLSVAPAARSKKKEKVKPFFVGSCQTYVCSSLVGFGGGNRWL